MERGDGADKWNPQILGFHSSRVCVSQIRNSQICRLWSMISRDFYIGIFGFGVLISICLCKLAWENISTLRLISSLSGLVWVLGIFFTRSLSACLLIWWSMIIFEAWFIVVTFYIDVYQTLDQNLGRGSMVPCVWTYIVVYVGEGWVVNPQNLRVVCKEAESWNFCQNCELLIFLFAECIS